MKGINNLERNEKIKYSWLYEYVKRLRKINQDDHLIHIVLVMKRRVPRETKEPQTIIREGLFITKRVDCPHCLHTIEVAVATFNHIKFCLHCGGRILTEKEEL